MLTSRCDGRREAIGTKIALRRWGGPMFQLFVLEPPPEYSHPYPGPVIERVLSLAEARRACARMGARGDACAWVTNGKCYIVIPRNGPVRDLHAYRRHEIAHCNGWPAGH